MRTPILVAVCLAVAALSFAGGDAQALPPKKAQNLKDPDWFGKCVTQYAQTGRQNTPAEICRRIKGRIEAKQKK
jgi:hypothetical protein